MSTPQQIADAFEQLGKELEDGRALIQPTLDVLTPRVKAAAPVRKGRLRNSLHGEIRSSTLGAVTSNVPYASIVDKRQRFVDKALAASGGEIDAKLGRAGEDLLSKVFP